MVRLVVRTVDSYCNGMVSKTDVRELVLVQLELGPVSFFHECL